MSAVVNGAGTLMSVVVFQRDAPPCAASALGNARWTKRPGLNTMSSPDKWVTLTPAEFALLQEYTQCE